MKSGSWMGPIFCAYEYKWGGIRMIIPPLLEVANLST